MNRGGIAKRSIWFPSNDSVRRLGEACRGAGCVRAGGWLSCHGRVQALPVPAHAGLAAASRAPLCLWEPALHPREHPRGARPGSHRPRGARGSQGPGCVLAGRAAAGCRAGQDGR